MSRGKAVLELSKTYTGRGLVGESESKAGIPGLAMGYCGIGGASEATPTVEGEGSSSSYSFSCIGTGEASAWSMWMVGNGVCGGIVST